MRRTGGITQPVARRQAGFTILEIIIVLTVGSLLFTSSIYIFTKNRASSQFREAMQDVETKFQDIINDTSTGYFDELRNAGCNSDGSNPPKFTGGALGQGKNSTCIFLGKAIYLAPDAEQRTIDIIPVVGYRQNGNLDVKDFNEAKPTTVVDPTDSDPDLTTNYQLRWGVRIRSAKLVGGGSSWLGGFYGSFGAFSQGTLRESGGQNTQFIAHQGPAHPALNGPGASKDAVKKCVEDTNDPDGCYGSYPAPPAAWEICFDDGDAASKRTATLTIGGGGSIASRLDILSEANACS